MNVMHNYIDDMVIDRWRQMIWLFIGGCRFVIFQADADMFFLGGCRRSQGDGRCLGHCG